MDVALATAPSLPDLVDDEAPLRRALSERGLDARPVVWSDPAVDWSAIPVVVVRTTWDYTERRDDFVSWAEEVGAVTQLWNPPELIRWNTHKAYLRDLADRGLPVVPTVWLEAGTPVDLPALLAEHGWDEAVLKPAVSAGARDTVRVSRGDGATGQSHADAILADRDLMIQPFLPRIVEDGELSILVVDGVVTHAVRKVPPAGDFRVSAQAGSRHRVEPPVREVELAAAALEAVGRDTLYARVDLIADGAGGPLLVELEVVEPSLYLELAPDAAARLADAIAARVRTPRPASSDASVPTR